MDLRTYLTQKASPLAAHVPTIEAAGKRYGIDPKLLVAIAGAETAFGTYKPSQTIYNAWGWGPHRNLGSWEQGIDTVARGLRKGYLDEGRDTIQEIGAKWAPVGAGNDPTNLNSNWSRNVQRFYDELGGAGAGGGAAAALPPAPAPSALARIPSTSRAAFTRALMDQIGKRKLDVGELLTAREQPLQEGGSMLQLDHGRDLGGGASTSEQVPFSATDLVTGGDWQEWVGIPEKRSGPSAPHRPEILQFVGKIGQLSRTKLTPWGNESHSLTTVNGTPSAHGTGHAADIPARGDELIRIGQNALIAAGADPAWARKQRGGLFNIGGYQVIFNTDVGGDHTDHVHVGIRGAHR